MRRRLQVELLAPAVTGTRNVLEACSEAKVKRVVVVSSLSAVMANPGWREGEAMDEGCWSDVEFCRNTEVILCSPKQYSFPSGTCISIFKLLKLRLTQRLRYIDFIIVKN